VIRIAWGLVLMLVAARLGAHPFHESQTEIDYRGECSCLEITLRVKPEEMEAALARSRAQRLPLEDPRMRPVLEDYVRNHFTLTDAGQRPVQLQWVGLQIDALGAWIYLQSAAVQLPLQLRHDLLFEHEAEQTNRVLFRANGTRQSLLFSRDAPTAQWLGEPADEHP
jgi:hypothetical protein